MAARAPRQQPLQRLSGFVPMARASRARAIEAANEQEESGEQQRNSIRAGREEGPLTRFELPDRRFQDQRHLEPQEVVNPNYIQPRQGGEENGRHVTLDGKPDRRFKENRKLSDEEAMEAWAETIIARHGPGRTRDK
jgi:hypothetical protein